MALTSYNPPASPSHSEYSSGSEYSTSREMSMTKEEVATLIVNFGASSAVDWLEPRYSLWIGHSHTSERPAVQGYVAVDGWCLAWGNPLAHTDDLEQVARDFLTWTEQKQYQVLWCCVDGQLQWVLSTLEYSVVTCIKEDTIDPMTVKWSSNDLKQNIRKAEKAGVEIVERTGFFTAEERAEINVGVEQWKKGRKGTQVASDSLAPWVDEHHRRYWIAQTADSQIVGLMVLARLKNGTYLIKNSIVFPDAPRGVSELLNASVIITLRKEGSEAVTFGVSASEELIPVSNVGSMSWLRKSYGVIVSTTGITNRSTYRQKYNPREDKLFVCYPQNGLGWSGIQALMKMLSSSSK
ncbi:hypothetical protein FRB97_008613 [Tulasnella sp. 331]|nr:hypothetical protein FRB97_008613 [Tulasnella sp. 331]KAG8886948.1 hypothetical protein FRB98_000720 [Tulasnella sp. 332]